MPARISAATTLRTLGTLDRDLADALVIELVAAVRDDVPGIVLDLRHAEPGARQHLARVVAAAAAARRRGLPVDVVARPRCWLLPLTAAGYDGVVLTEAPETRRGIVLVGRRTAA